MPGLLLRFISPTHKPPVTRQLPLGSLPDGWYTFQLRTVNSISFFWYNMDIENHGQTYRRISEILRRSVQKGIISSFQWVHEKLTSKNLGKWWKKFLENHGYLLINSVLKMLFQLSPCFENWSGSLTFRVYGNEYTFSTSINMRTQIHSVKNFMIHRF